MFEKYKPYSTFDECNSCFNLGWFKNFDKDSFKINHDDVNNGNTQKHQEAFLEMSDYFRELLKANSSSYSIENYKKNRAIYGTFCSYFRAFVPFKNNSRFHLSFVVRKEFLSIEAGFQLKDLHSEDMLNFNKIILDIIQEEELEFLEDFGFDLLYTKLEKKDTEVSLNESARIFNDGTLNDGVCQFRWKVLRTDFESNPSRSSSEIPYIISEMSDFFKYIQEKMPQLIISGNEHKFQRKTIPASDLDKNFSLELPELEKKYGSSDEWDYSRVFPGFTESVKESLLDFVCGGIDHAYVDIEATDSIEIEWPLGEDISIPPVKEVACEFLDEEPILNVNFVLYRLMENGSHTFRLNSFTSPLVLKTLTHVDVQDAGIHWGFVKSLTQDKQELEFIDGESEMAWDDLGDRLLVFMGSDLVYDGFVSDQCSFDEYDEWDEDIKTEFDELAGDVTELLLDRGLEIISDPQYA